MPGWGGAKTPAAGIEPQLAVPLPLLPMKTHHSLLVCGTATILLSVHSSPAAVATWDGSIDGSWTSAATGDSNWTGGAVSDNPLRN